MAGVSAGLYCKSFKPDFDHLQVLLDSFERHNPENLALTLSLPAADIAAFRDRFGGGRANIVIVPDESYCAHDLSRYRGWHSQQICKLMSWVATGVDHYAVIDSDCYFVADVTAAELLPRAGRKHVVCGSSLRTVMSADNRDLLAYLKGELAPSAVSYPAKGDDPIQDRLSAYHHFKHMNPDSPDALKRSDIPFKIFGAKRWFFYQPMQMFSTALLKALKDFFDRSGMTIGDAILVSPWEYNWYGEFASAAAADDVDYRISPYLHFPDEAAIEVARANGISEDVVARKFLFVAMAARHLDALTYRDV